MALAGQRLSSNTEVEGSNDGGSKINSKEHSNYNSHSHGIMDQNKNINGYSDAYTLGHSETSNTEFSRSDNISNILSNTYTKENGWSKENSESNTSTNGRTFGNSYSNSVMKEISKEDTKTISTENTNSRIVSNTVFIME
ncbi:hypothetical protein BCR36DRAFT_92162 [Piromyces finnis]|uniref:Uncharacterized protein n=1 Tax=Piromyces finnis TaxID=1754191 RepID=A0A1Y1VMJ2_9FUNG|nr:hypothetical protein BCR36DRAFT_92162 [Piromyces finnis]|eukprot:ORX59365.1 hypothetical protein BCR36DRAFT_92162 [Piromyces finnis]